MNEIRNKTLCPDQKCITQKLSRGFKSFSQLYWYMPNTVISDNRREPKTLRVKKMNITAILGSTDFNDGAFKILLIFPFRISDDTI